MRENIYCVSRGGGNLLRLEIEVIEAAEVLALGVGREDKEEGVLAVVILEAVERQRGGVLRARQTTDGA